VHKFSLPFFCRHFLSSSLSRRRRSTPLGGKSALASVFFRYVEASSFSCPFFSCVVTASRSSRLPSFFRLSFFFEFFFVSLALERMLLSNFFYRMSFASRFDHRLVPPPVSSFVRMLRQPLQTLPLLAHHSPFVRHPGLSTF